MDYESIKRLGLDHYNIDLEKSFETFDSSNNNHTIVLYLKKDKTISCPYCFSNHLLSRGSKSNNLKYSSAVENNINIKLYRRVYKCLDCDKTFKEENIFTSSKKQITIQKDLQILNALRDKTRTYTSVAKEFNVSTSYVIDMFDRKVDLKRLQLPQVLCIDEVYAKKLTKHSYCCVLYSPQWKKIIDILDSRHKLDLIDYFSRIPKQEKDNVKFISIDMWDSYRQMAKLCLPKAIICVDSFHVISHLSSAFKSIRIKIMKKYEHLKKENDNYYWLFKKYSNFLMADVSKLPEYIKVKHSGMYLSKYRIIEDMLSLDDNLRLAYELKEEYRNFNSSATILNAEEWLDELILKFLNSNISEYYPFANLLINWRDEIINSFNRLNDHRISNGPMERVNRDIKTIFEISFGSTNFTRVRNRVIFSINDSSPILYHRKSSSNKRIAKPRGKYKKD